VAEYGLPPVFTGLSASKCESHTGAIVDNMNNYSNKE
jgi:hypothetical protein